MCGDVVAQNKVMKVKIYGQRFFKHVMAVHHTGASLAQG